MRAEIPYIEESAGDFFDQLCGIAEAADMAVHRRYEALEAVFRRAVDQRLLTSTVAFAGLFAKVDHLLRECDVDATVARQINATRQRLRHAGETAAEELEQTWPYDLKNVVRLIVATYPEAAVPARLARHLPSTDRETERQSAFGECLRVVAGSRNGTIIEATTEAGEAVTIDCSGPWEPTSRLVGEGTQLNIVRPRMENGRVVGELVIVEPDYLVDISAVAACFESYGATPYTYLLNQIRPSLSTAPMLLGNLASQMLDDAVNAPGRSYAATATQFFRSNALAVATTEGIDSHFHEQARLQQAHIARAIGSALPAAVGTEGTEATLLEPSFVCERLGLQGRMDFLRIDLAHPRRCTLIEQKSGKGGFPPLPDPSTPRHVEAHYVQLLLYMAVLRYGHGLSNAAVSALLLYSRYPNSLLKLGPAPQLLCEAITLRNQSVWLQMHCADGHADILLRLTPEMLNVRHAGGRLWEQWQRPAIAQLLAPLQSATPLEQAYVLRFTSFVMREHLLAKIGNKTKECSGYASKWLNTLAEKLAAGNIVCGMSIGRVLPDAEGRAAVGAVELLLGSETDAEGANFRTGDIVTLYAYAAGREPDVRRAIVLRATVEQLSTSHARLRMRHPQASDAVFRRPPGYLWAMEHDLIESSATMLLRSLHSLLHTTSRRRNLVLAQRKPETDPEVELAGRYGAFDGLVTRAMQARDLFLVIGPPGTGKTSFAMLNILKEQLLQPDTAVLLTAYTNRAVDEMCSKLVGEGIDFVRLGSDAVTAEALHDHLLSRRVAGCTTADDVRLLLARTRVVCATTSSLNANTSLFKLKHFDLAIVDEASQILEPQMVGLLAATEAGREAIDRFVLIGDHKQLPAVVQQSEAESAVTDPRLRAIGIENCRQSLFERLLRAHRDDPAVVYELTRQGRMHRDIAAFPSMAFYEGHLRVVPLPHQERPLAEVSATGWAPTALSASRMSFVDVALPDDDMPDKVNTADAAVVAELAALAWREARGAFDHDQTLGIIVPYRSQIAAIRAAMMRTGIAELGRVAIDTVERFQGSQRDIIIYDFTVRRPYQLNFLAQTTFIDNGQAIDRKLNVALTRAKEHLVMVGNAKLIARNPTFDRLLQYVREHGEMVEGR